MFFLVILAFCKMCFRISCICALFLDMNDFSNLAVLDFTLQFMESGVKNDAVLALIVFSLQYVLVNHEYWKYKLKHTRWRVTLKVKLMVSPVLVL